LVRKILVSQPKVTLIGQEDSDWPGREVNGIRKDSICDIGNVSDDLRSEFIFLFVD
jgi:hypothetical protein